MEICGETMRFCGGFLNGRGEMRLPALCRTQRRSMSTRSTLILSLLLIAAALTLSIAVYDRLPAAMASHWSANDQVNGSREILAIC